LYSIAILGTAPPVGAAHPPPAQLDQPLDSFVSHHRILLVVSCRNPFTSSNSYPSPTSNLASADPTQGVVRSSNTLRLSSSALSGSRLATRFYDASSLFFDLWSSSLSVLRLRVCLNMCHHFNALPGASSALPTTSVRFPLVEPRQAHTPSFIALLERSKSPVVPVRIRTDVGERPRSTAFSVFFFLAGFLSISTTAESGIFCATPDYSHDVVLHLCTLLEAFA
jgi:hypothetical protein